MANYDIKVAKRQLYAPPFSDFVEVDVPSQAYLMVDGHGDPDLVPQYAAAVQALYTVSYGVRFLAKRELGLVHTVAPLEGLWWADDPTAFVQRRRDEWHWTMLIAQPDWITAEMVDTVAAAKEVSVRLETLTEGRSVQILHVGSYADEAPTLARLHDEYLPQHGLTFNGPHHEIYLSDPRRVEAAKLRTVLRQPVAALTDSNHDSRAHHH